jgi:hypothetical protein
MKELRRLVDSLATDKKIDVREIEARIEGKLRKIVEEMSIEGETEH